MRFFIHIHCILWLVSLLLPSHIYAEQANHLQRILQSGKLRVAVFYKDFSPFFWKDKQSGTLRGVDIDLARGIASKLGLQIEFDRTATSFDRMVEMVAAKEVDLVISNLSVTPSRKRKLLFSNHYVAMRRGLIINKARLASLNLPAGMHIVE
ncbi:MAG: hypothetical protein D3924_17255, partial [Candidatus Electrothrix sp. AR4]|nr:hypothetical protein [Candidatus Electrothrix sp. AR4]